MSDYGAIIGGVVGAVVGGVVTLNPSGVVWGWSIGSSLGGAYSASQQVIPGPKIGDVQRQTSQEGGFRAIVYGRSHPISGNVIADGGPVIVKKKESQGKGGPKVETESAYRTYAVGFCEGQTSLLQAWRNGTLVYDSEDSSMSAENAKFFEYARWYSGSFDQTADPDIEGIYGVGNAPFFRGTSYLVLAHEDVTDQRGAWSQWQVRVFRGASTSYTTPPYAVLEVDAVEARVTPVLGTLKTVLFTAYGIDASQLSVEPIGGELRDNIARAYSDNDYISLDVNPIGGTLRAPVTQANQQPSHATVSVQPANGTLRAALIPANQQPSVVTIAITPLTGALS